MMNRTGLITDDKELTTVGINVAKLKIEINNQKKRRDE